MPDPKFPGPTEDSIIDEDPQIVGVGNKPNLDIGSRPVTTEEVKKRNEMPITHVRD